MSMELLVVDDDRVLRESMKKRLEREGYAVRTARNGNEAIEAFKERRSDLVLLDVDMPVRGGISTCMELRKLDALVPVVFLTAFDSEVDQVRGYGAGCDGYFSKTEPVSVLLAAIAANLRRGDAAKERMQDDRTVTIGGVVANFDALTLLGGGVDERMTKTEADILWLLNSERGVTFAYATILKILGARGFTGDDNSLYVHIRHLRNKLGKAGELLINERSVGYRLMA